MSQQVPPVTGVQVIIVGCVLACANVGWLMMVADYIIQQVRVGR